MEFNVMMSDDINPNTMVEVGHKTREAAMRKAREYAKAAGAHTHVAYWVEDDQGNVVSKTYSPR